MVKCPKCEREVIEVELKVCNGRCEACWLESQGVDMRGKFVQGGQGPKGNKSNGPSPKVWPKVCRG